MKNYQINLPADAMQVVLNGLGKLPLEMALPVWSMVGQQIDAQNRPNPAPEMADAIERSNDDLKMALPV